MDEYQTRRGRATAVELDGARWTLVRVLENDGLTGEQRDQIEAVRRTLAMLASERREATVLGTVPD